MFQMVCLSPPRSVTSLWHFNRYFPARQEWISGHPMLVWFFSMKLLSCSSFQCSTLFQFVDKTLYKILVNNEFSLNITGEWSKIEITKCNMIFHLSTCRVWTCYWASNWTEHWISVNSTCFFFNVSRPVKKRYVVHVFPLATGVYENHCFYKSNLLCLHILKGWKFLLLSRQNFWRRYGN